MPKDDQSTDTMDTPKERVLVVGAGAAGMAAAWSLSQIPDRYEVEVWDSESCAGGVATNVEISSVAEDTSQIPQGIWINDGVQGCSPAYHNTMNFFKAVGGFECSPVNFTVSFGKGEYEWSNYVEKPLIERLAPEVERFGRVLKTINRFEYFFIFIPISKVLSWWGFSEDFGTRMVYPLTALFFGTGNQTASVSAAIIARVFLDPELRLFDYDPRRLLSQKPQMYAFPNLAEVYAACAKSVHAKVHFNRPVSQVVRTSKGVTVKDTSGTEAHFDHIIFACNAETVLKVLEKPTWIEKRVLGNVTYYDDVTVTHTDGEYMHRHYSVDEVQDQYFIKTYETDPTRLEMSFNLSNYQPNLRNLKTQGGLKGTNIYQTIFLDKNGSGNLWTIEEIDRSKIVLEKWWRQFAHTWRHFAFTVPFIRFLHGKNRTYYAGAYTLFNTHELAIVSGFAAAYRLGAPYPFPDDDLAVSQFEQFMSVAHGKLVRVGARARR
eukprot:comp14519_c0_seq1/m.10718 comp14519_c0_seq1/g.10718  ORF comp14519_c0_seq1/g.10718 comp14519_c0_seq1/m.10718 type:complete len:490 (-) comp14519_c0_seq1:1-1470(-)